MRLPRLSVSRRVVATAVGGVLAVSAAIAVDSAVTPATASPTAHKPIAITSTGLRAGQIKHVWLIILENKSYDATFSGLNQNSYLWKSLPKQGVLLKNYYGTGHSSMDNYLSLVSGQAPEEDTQEDCSVADTNFGSNATIVKSGKNKGQVASTAGANAVNGKNGCTYPTDTPTLFNQLDAAHKTWKGYAQDLHNQPGREDATCGGPGTAANNPDTNPTQLSATNTFPPGVTSFTGAQSNDQYVAKHFPFPWFHGLTGNVTSTGTTPGLTKPAQGGTDCDAAHIANLDDSKDGLYHDLQKVSTTPAFSWITPNNCSDAHDALCKGNNLSGSFTKSGSPIYQSPTPDPESTTPKNFTGGLYASDLFLKYYIPMIEKSPAFKQGGLIDITFDEANPPFTYTGNSFNDATDYGPLNDEPADAKTALKSDYAGERINGRNVKTEPTGVNSTLATNSDGDQLFPGPGNNAFIDRPPACTAPGVPSGCVQGLVAGGAGSIPVARTDSVAANGSSSIVSDPSVVSTDTGRIVTDTTDTTGADGGSPIPLNTFVGTVSNTGPLHPTTNAGPVVQSSFQLVDQSGNPVTPSGNVTKLTFSPEGAPDNLTAGETPDPLYDATDPTPGGGDTGSVLISPFIKPGTSTTHYYNHYSWLRTMEDIFGVSKGSDHKSLPGGTVSGGVDGKGHLGYAGQPGLDPFGPDVFNNVPKLPKHKHKPKKH